MLATAFVDELGDSDNVVLIRFADSMASLVLPRFLFLTSRPARIVAITSEGFDTEDSGRRCQHVRGITGCFTFSKPSNAARISHNT